MNSFDHSLQEIAKSITLPIHESLWYQRAESGKGLSIKSIKRNLTYTFHELSDQEQHTREDEYVDVYNQVEDLETVLRINKINW